MNNFMHSISQIFLATALTVSSVFAPHTVHKTNHPTVKVQQEANDPNMETLKGKIGADGYTLALNLSYPKNGGPINGTISGTCDGKITGDYNNTNNKINGVAHGICDVAFIHMPGTIRFNGTLDPKTSTANLHYNATSSEFSKNGTVTLSLHSSQ
jgi:hypothetical protein